jgi:hypothetical protein
MTISATTCIASAAKIASTKSPDLFYIQVTAWATVALVIATIFMIVWQIISAKKSAKVQLAIQFIDRYDSEQMRSNRRALALSLINHPVDTSSNTIEPVIDALESIADLLHRKWLDKGVIDNSFSVCARYWWIALEGYITKMRNDYHDTTLYERFEGLAKLYEKENKKRHVPPLSNEQLAVFLESEAG